MTALGFRVGLTSTEFALSVLKNLLKADNEEDFLKRYRYAVESVLSDRPSNYGCINALKAIGFYLLSNPSFKLEDALRLVNKLMSSIDNACTQAAIIASNRVSDGDVLMINSRSICVERLFKTLVDKGLSLKVYVLESRPGMEGLETARFLDEQGVDTHLIIDSAARYFIKNVDKVIIGVEAVAVNGAVIGKVGTSLLSLIANESRVRVLAIAPLYKFSYETIFGEMFEISEVGWDYLMDDNVRKTLPENYKVYVPLFDVTPPTYIDVLATEYGLLNPHALTVVAKQTEWFKYSSYRLDDIIAKLSGG